MREARTVSAIKIFSACEIRAFLADLTKNFCYINIPVTLLNGPDTGTGLSAPRIPDMSASATRKKRIAAPGPSAASGGLTIRDRIEADIELSSYRLQRIPLGILHLNSDWRVLEYRDPEGDNGTPPSGALGKHLFSLAPWIRHPGFVQTLKTAIRSGTGNSHFDFKISVKSAERMIHVNIFALGDATAWLFISDNSLPPL